ncbi:MAG: hypothetical protein K2I96_03785, partial [Lachnospiraceae bacterium]|nr:hypothetical protein [Lachnospiraceae bacterium]
IIIDHIKIRGILKEKRTYIEDQLFIIIGVKRNHGNLNTEGMQKLFFGSMLIGILWNILIYLSLYM